MMRYLFGCAALLILTLQPGCANRCNQPGGYWLSGNTRIAPPPTYSLNIPSVANNQPYYSPGGAAVNPTGSAPTPADSNLQWRQPNDSSQTSPNSNSNSINGSRFVETNSPAPGRSVLGQIVPPAGRTAALPASGSSFTDSRNFQTTQVDERQDSSRIPVTDATSVRAPSQNLVAGYGVPQTYAQSYNGPRVFSVPGSVVQPYQPNTFSGQPIVVANNYGTPQPVPSISVASQPGWRNRELGSDRLR